MLAVLNSNEAPLTGTGSALCELMHQMSPVGWSVQKWRLRGQASTRQFNALWQGFKPDEANLKSTPGPRDRCMAEARLHAKLTPGAGYGGDSLTIELDALLTNPLRPHTDEVLDRFMADLDKPGPSRRSSELGISPGPFVGIGAIRQIMLDVIGALWGPPGNAMSTGILGQPLGQPAQLDLTCFTLPILKDRQPPRLDACIDFGLANLIDGNTPGAWTRLGPIQPDHAFFSRAEQAKVVHEWLIQLGIDNGYQNIEQEVTRYTGITAAGAGDTCRQRIARRRSAFAAFGVVDDAAGS